MRENIKVRVASVLERIGLSKNINEVASLLARYICRLTGSREYRKEIRCLLNDHTEEQEDLIKLKSSLDYSSVKNQYFRAIHSLANTKKPDKSAVVDAAKMFKLDCEDLDFLYQALPIGDLTKVGSRILSEHGYSDKDLVKILKQIEYLMRSLVYRRMSFILNNDPMVESGEDLMSPLRIAAVKVVREYEIQDISYEHMLSMVIKGVQNQARNMAECYGRGKRQPVVRTRAIDPHRILWYFNIRQDTVYPVRSFKDQSMRCCYDGNVCVTVQAVDSDDWSVVHHKRLYVSEKEALAARDKRRVGKRSKRDVYADLAPQQIDDFHPVVISMDNEATAFHFQEQLPTAERPDLPEVVHRMRQILHGLPPRAREFAELVFSSDVDELFDAWCDDNGYNLNTCDDAQLGRLACKYLNLSKTQLKIELAGSSITLWTTGEQETIMGGVTSIPIK